MHIFTRDLPAGKIIIFSALSLTLLLVGCSTIVKSQTMKLADSISSTVNNSADIDTVSKAIPTFLLLVDSLIQDDPDNAELLATSASLYNGYAGLFDSDDPQLKVLANKSFTHSLRAVCLDMSALCNARSIGFEDFQATTAYLSSENLNSIYILAVSWLGWIQANSSDWNAVAEISRPKLLLEKVNAIDEGYKYGSANIYLGVLESLIPPSLGGKPELGKKYFERAQALSSGKNQMVKVLYAKHYARLIFNRELHHRLLTEVIEHDQNVADFVLINALAAKHAKQLLATEDDYF